MKRIIQSYTCLVVALSTSLQAHPLQDQLVEVLIAGLGEAEVRAVWIGPDQVQDSKASGKLVFSPLHKVESSMVDEFVRFLRKAHSHPIPFKAATGHAYTLFFQNGEGDVIGLLYRERFGKDRFMVLFGRISENEVIVEGRWSMYLTIPNEDGDTEEPTGVELRGFQASPLHNYVVDSAKNLRE